MPYDDGKPQAAPSSSSDGIHIPIDALVARSPSSPRDTRGTKRVAEEDSFGSRPPPKGPRLSGEYASRNSNGRGPPPSGPRNSDARGGRSGRAGKTGPSSSRSGRQKEACRDYHSMSGAFLHRNFCSLATGSSWVLPSG